MPARRSTFPTSPRRTPRPPGTRSPSAPRDAICGASGPCAAGRVCTCCRRPRTRESSPCAPTDGQTDKRPSRVWRSH
ncbi:MAG: hypothetical protein EXR72_26625 [Myxococcales bacterium]|nr:hypothetical protein [Myxococcales bacterium]